MTCEFLIFKKNEHDRQKDCTRACISGINSQRTSASIYSVTIEFIRQVNQVHGVNDERSLDERRETERERERERERGNGKRAKNRDENASPIHLARTRLVSRRRRKGWCCSFRSLERAKGNPVCEEFRHGERQVCTVRSLHRGPGRILFAIKKPDGLVPASDIPQILTAKSRRQGDEPRRSEFKG